MSTISAKQMLTDYCAATGDTLTHGWQHRSGDRVYGWWRSTDAGDHEYLGGTLDKATYDLGMRPLFVRNAGLHINDVSVAICGYSDGVRLRIQAYDGSKKIGEPIELTRDEYDAMVPSDPYDDMASTVSALRLCGVNIEV